MECKKSLISWKIYAPFETDHEMFLARNYIYLVFLPNKKCKHMEFVILLLSGLGTHLTVWKDLKYPT